VVVDGLGVGTLVGEVKVLNDVGATDGNGEGSEVYGHCSYSQHNPVNHTVHCVLHKNSPGVQFTIEIVGARVGAGVGAPQSA